MKSIFGSLIIAAMLVNVPSFAQAQSVHEGMQFRATAGFGYLLDTETNAGTTATIKGGAENFSAYLGGSLKRNIFFGAYLSDTHVQNPQVTFRGIDYQTSNYNLDLFSTGLYLDGYDSNTSLHGLTTFGLGSVFVQGSNNSPSGLGYSVGFGLGYDWWVSHSTTVGILGKVDFNGLQVKTSTENIIVPTLALSISYH